MSSVCISNCINDARDTRVPARPVRATYVSLHRWPESEAEFVRSVRRGGGPRVVDSISCRQMYLRSYTFSREEDHTEEEKKKNRKKKKKQKKKEERFGRVKETASYGKEEDEEKNVVVAEMTKRRRSKKRTKGKNGFGLRRMKELSCSALFRFFNRLLSCAATVDVVDLKDY